MIRFLLRSLAWVVLAYALFVVVPDAVVLALATHAGRPAVVEAILPELRNWSLVLGLALAVVAEVPR